MSLLAAGLIALNCTPALPFYCENIHVGCAGRTRLKTERFEISDQNVTFQNGSSWEADLTHDRRAMILRRANRPDWIRIEADGTFSLRRYAPRAMMTRGTCSGMP